MNLAKKSQNSKASKYTIPKNLCQNCYQRKGRYVLHCFCIICQECYTQCQPFYSDDHNKVLCRFCRGQTTTNVIDCTRPQSVGKLQFLFKNMNKTFSETVQAFKFQDTIRKRYCQYLQTKLKAYQDAIMDLVKINPSLQNYFKKRLNMSSKEFQRQLNKTNKNKSLPVPKTSHDTEAENISQAQSIRSKHYGDRQFNMNQKIERSSSSDCNFQPNKIKRKVDYQKNFSGGSGILKSNMRPQIKIDILGSKEIVRDILSDKKNKNYQYYMEGQSVRPVEFQNRQNNQKRNSRDQSQQYQYYPEKKSMKDVVNLQNQHRTNLGDYHQRQHIVPMTPHQKQVKTKTHQDYQNGQQFNPGDQDYQRFNKNGGIDYRQLPKEYQKNYQIVDRESNNQFAFQKSNDFANHRKQHQRMQLQEGNNYSKRINPIKSPSFNFQNKQFRAGNKK